MVAARDISQDEDLLLSYGALDNTFLLLDYGALPCLNAGQYLCIYVSGKILVLSNLAMC